MENKNIFVIGLEPFNKALLEGLPGANRYVFHDLLSYGEAVRPTSSEINLGALLETAERRLAEFSGTIDGIIGYWDFPTSVIVPVLSHRHGLPSAPLQAVAACEHKYWCRLEQIRTIPDLVPQFCPVDPFADDPMASIDLPFPFWIKPVKAHSSYLGFKIRDEADFRACLPLIRAGISRFGVPFDAFLEMVDLPDTVVGIGGHHCIAEEIISFGQQCTLEGYVYRGETVVYGVVDSIREGRHRSSFSRYQYPSRLPCDVQERMIASIRRFLAHIGYDNAPFNAEFYWDPRTDAIRILEINTRLSKSHCPLFLMVDSASHQKVAVDLTLGRRPDFPRCAGRHRIAAKFMVRLFADGTVVSIPDEAEFARVRGHFPDALMRVLVRAGTRLAHLPYQDSYSFELAEIFLGARSQSELLENYRTVRDLLPFRIDPLEENAA